MKRVVITTALTLLSLNSVLADVIWLEKFDYTNGSISITSTNGTGSTTVSNWLTHSGNLDALVNNRRLEICSSSANGPLTITRSGDIHRLLSITNNAPYTNSQQVLYASFIVNFTNLPVGAGTYFAHFYVNSSTFPGRVWAQTNGTVAPNTFRLGISSGAALSKLYPVDLALKTDYQVVIGYCPVTGDANLVDDSTTLWINPVSLSDAPTISNDSFTPGTSIANSFAFRQASGFGAFLTASNLVIATTFDEAATNVLSTNAVAPTIVTQPVGTTNFPSSSIILAAVVNGQGLGSMSYQWQQDGTNYTTNPGNASVLSIPSTQLEDSGNFTLIATTPHGLSVTSTVAKVKIFDGPFPPQFVSQPAKLTVFRGQTATFTTTVIGPASGGTPVFTWFSNNVVITAGQMDNGFSSSYVLNNTLTNYSATYKVGVTNTYGGIISSNVLLTVSNPPVVSIAFLRSLIDPVTFVTTASPTQPFQATGIITSFTNTTSGDTSSYYLQDATAGINIFATFGSTFRPQPGDVVTFVGVLSTFNAATGGLELFADTVNRPYTSYSIVSNNFPLPAARVIPFTVTNDFGYLYLNTNLMAERVTLTNVYFGTNAGTQISTAANVTLTVTNQNGTNFTLAFYNLDLDTAGQTLPAFATSVTGNLIGFHPNVFLAVTKFSDIVSVVPSIPLGVSFSGGILTFNWTDPSFDLQSATNVLGPYTTITGAATGFATNTLSGQMYFRLHHP